MPSEQSGDFVNNGSAVDAMTSDHLSPRERKALLSGQLGTPFDPFERLFASYDEGTVFAYEDIDAAEYRAMLRRDGKAVALEQILTLPIRGSDWTITPDDGDQGQAKFIEANLGDKLNLIIDQMTSACVYRRAFFETIWTTDDNANVVLKEVAFRPATGCEAGFDPHTGKYKGYRQRLVPVAGLWPYGEGPKRKPDDGWQIIAPNRAFVYVHGIHRDPIQGISELEVAHWAYTTKQKLMFLWFQYLEQQALPKMLIYGDDETQANERATKLRGLRASGVLGMERTNEPGAKVFDILESAGRGADGYQNAINYLDSMMSASVLAGFTDLTAATGGSAGSYALSADQSEFFLNARQAVADEMADAIRRDLFGPLVAFNFGVQASVPKIRIGPISKEQGKNALHMLETIITAVNLNVPRDFVDQLTILCSGALGMNQTKVKAAIKKDATARQAQQELQAQVNQAQAIQAVHQAAMAGEQQAAAASGAATGDATAPPPVTTGGAPSTAPSGAQEFSAAVDAAFDLVRTGGRDV